MCSTVHYSDIGTSEQTVSAGTKKEEKEREFKLDILERTVAFVRHLVDKVADLEDEVARLKTGSPNHLLKYRTGNVNEGSSSKSQAHNASKIQAVAHELDEDVTEVDVNMNIEDDDEDEDGVDIAINDQDQEQPVSKSEMPTIRTDTAPGVTRSARVPPPLPLSTSVAALPAPSSPSSYLSTVTERSSERSTTTGTRRTSVSSSTVSIAVSVASTPRRLAQRLPSISALLNDVDDVDRPLSRRRISTSASGSTSGQYISEQAPVLPKSSLSPLFDGRSDSSVVSTEYNRHHPGNKEDFFRHRIKGGAHDYGLLSPPASGRLEDPNAVSSTIAAHYASMSAPLPALRLPSPSASQGWRSLELGAPALSLPPGISTATQGSYAPSSSTEGRSRSHSYSHSNRAPLNGDGTGTSVRWTHEDESAASLLLHMSSRSSASGSPRRSLSTSLSPSTETRAAMIAAASVGAAPALSLPPSPSAPHKHRAPSDSKKHGKEGVKAQTPGGMLGLAFP